jgi:phosphoglycerate dehydrogenase-like enzyme
MLNSAPTRPQTLPACRAVSTFAARFAKPTAPSDVRAVHMQDFSEWIREVFDAALTEAGIETVWAGSAPDGELADIVAGADVLLTAKRRIGAQLVAVPGLKLVQVQGRAPWAVDWTAAHDTGVSVSVLPHGGAIAVAEQAMALMLGVYRMLVPGHQGTVDAAYRDKGIEPVRTTERLIAFNWLGFDSMRQLSGKTLGLVGLGDIGLEVARRARAFDMNVLYHKRLPWLPEFEQMAGVRHVPLAELLAVSDVVSLHAPHTDSTERMIDAAALALMKSDAILINTARGGLVDETALVEALREGRIAGAGLDAFVEEPLPIEHPLVDCPNVLLSPHVGGGTGGGQRGMIRSVVENLQRVARGEPALGLVTTSKSEGSSEA